MPENFTVESVIKKEEWEGNYGAMVTYRLIVNGQEVDLNQKPETPAPTEGQEIWGHLEPGKFRQRLKKDQKEGATSSGGSRNFPRSQGKSPDQQRSIVRQHSQEMALRALELFSTSEWREDDLKAAILKWTDFFEADANAAVQEAAVSQLTEAFNAKPADTGDTPDALTADDGIPF